MLHDWGQALHWSSGIPNGAHSLVGRESFHFIFKLLAIGQTGSLLPLPTTVSSQELHKTANCLCSWPSPCNPLHTVAKAIFLKHKLGCITPLLKTLSFSSHLEQCLDSYIAFKALQYLSLPTSVHIVHRFQCSHTQTILAFFLPFKCSNLVLTLGPLSLFFPLPGTSPSQRMHGNTQDSTPVSPDPQKGPPRPPQLQQHPLTGHYLTTLFYFPHSTYQSAPEITQFLC